MRTLPSGSRFLLVSALVALCGGLGAVSATASSAAPVPAPAAPSTISTFPVPLTVVGQVNLTAVAATEVAASPPTTPQGAGFSRGAAAAARYRAVDDAVLAHRPRGVAAAVPNPPATPLSTDNVPGERGFSALGGIQQASTAGGTDLEPPDQGLCAGGGDVMEFINNALTVYSSSGSQLLAPIGTAAALRQPSTDFFSDPRCYYDAPTQRWFFQEFVVGTVNAQGHATSPSIQYEAVSNTADPVGTYTVYSWDTTDAATKGCPCFGDYDELGADANGIYITTDEFSIAGSAYNGVIAYAIPKALIETAAATGIPVSGFGYRITADPFGQPYIVAPTTTPPGARFAPGTEYFVESNGNTASASKLMVYALNDTSVLAAPAAPTMYRTSVTAEPYAAPSDAAQKAGPRPLGAAYGAPPGGIQADFDAEMEPVYRGGDVYAQLDTATKSGNDAVAWFVLQPTLSGSPLALSATVAHQGYVAVAGASLLYPYTAVNAAGRGYLLFSLSGRSNYPSPAYITYGPDGPVAPVRVATAGAGPEDGFTCYAAFTGPTYGGCRWGDYSMGAVMGNRVYMAAEMVPQGYRDLLTNWGTYIWSAPPSNG